VREHFDVSDGSLIYPQRDFDRITAFSHSGALVARVIKPADVFRQSCQAEELLPNFAGHKKFTIILAIKAFPSVEPRHRRRR
jgi:hypothetical protein